MALYHPGAFAGSLHGSTKTTTFRRSRTGIVAYDRPDSHPTRAAGHVKASTPATFGMYGAVKLASALGIIPTNAYKEGKRSSGYNEFVKALSLGVRSLLTNDMSPLFEKTPSAEVFDEYFVTEIQANGTSYAAACSIVFGQGGIFEVAGQQATQGTGKAVVSLAGSKSAQTIEVTCFDGKSHKVEGFVVSLMNAAKVATFSGTLDGLTSKTFSTAVALTQVANDKSPWFEKCPALAIVKIDGVPVNSESGTVIVAYPNA